MLVLNALVRKSSDLLEFNQKHNAAIFHPSAKLLLYRQARSQGGHSGAVLPNFLCPQNFIVPRKICFKHKVKAKILSP